MRDRSTSRFHFTTVSICNAVKFACTFFRETNMLVVYVARCILSSYKRPICNPVSDVAYFDDLTIVSADTCISVTVLYNCSGPQWHLAECCTTMYVPVVVVVSLEFDVSLSSAVFALTLASLDTVWRHQRHRCPPSPHSAARSALINNS